MENRIEFVDPIEQKVEENMIVEQSSTKTSEKENDRKNFIEIFEDEERFEFEKAKSYKHGQEDVEKWIKQKTLQKTPTSTNAIAQTESGAITTLIEKNIQNHPIEATEQDEEITIINPTQSTNSVKEKLIINISDDKIIAALKKIEKNTSLLEVMEEKSRAVLEQNHAYKGKLPPLKYTVALTSIILAQIGSVFWNVLQSEDAVSGMVYEIEVVQGNGTAESIFASRYDGVTSSILAAVGTSFIFTLKYLLKEGVVNKQHVEKFFDAVQTSPDVIMNIGFSMHLMFMILATMEGYSQPSNEANEALFAGAVAISAILGALGNHEVRETLKQKFGMVTPKYGRAEKIFDAAMEAFAGAGLMYGIVKTSEQESHEYNTLHAATFRMVVVATYMAIRASWMYSMESQVERGQLSAAEVYWQRSESFVVAATTLTTFITNIASLPAIENELHLTNDEKILSANMQTALFTLTTGMPIATIIAVEMSKAIYHRQQLQHQEPEETPLVEKRNSDSTVNNNYGSIENTAVNKNKPEAVKDKKNTSIFRGIMPALERLGFFKNKATASVEKKPEELNYNDNQGPK